MKVVTEGNNLDPDVVYLEASVPGGWPGDTIELEEDTMISLCNRLADGYLL